MRWITFGNPDKFRIAVLTRHLNQEDVFKYYVQPLVQHGIPQEEIIAIELPYDTAKKVSAATIKANLNEILDECHSLGVSHLLCNDANYFKKLIGDTKAEVHRGYVLEQQYSTETPMYVTLGINHRQIIWNPEDGWDKNNRALNALGQHLSGAYNAPGDIKFKHLETPSNYTEIAAFLRKLHKYPRLFVDIEAFSLKFYKAGIASIGFAWNEGCAGAFLVDYSPGGFRGLLGGTKDPDTHGYRKKDFFLRRLLRSFFEEYKGEVVWHNSSYDLKALIYTLWMEEDHLRKDKMLDGLHVLTNRIHDTKHIAYLATNNCGGNTLGLKELAQPFTGNYAEQEIANVLKVPPEKLLRYNAIDCVATAWVFNKYYPKMLEEGQGGVYTDLFMPSNKMLIQAEMVGMPMVPEKIQYARDYLETKLASLSAVFDSEPLVEDCERLTAHKKMVAANKKLKIKQHPIEKFLGDKFNPNSDDQCRDLLYEIMGLPVIDLTEGKQPATGKDTIDKLLHHTADAAHLRILNALKEYSEASKILSSFIPAFEAAIPHYPGDPYVWLHGNLNLGGTVSGRLSSSDPNLQNIPSGSTYGKLIKDCFAAPDGMLFGGADFSALEDMISALTTRDSNKMKVYLEGYDGHCLRAYSYWPERLPGIENTVESINSIKKLFPDVRKESKTPTFLLTYGGTHHGLMSNLGMDETTAMGIYNNYHNLYSESDQWVEKKIDGAIKDGFVQVAFGLKVRTPLLGQVVNRMTMPYSAQKESRTAGNALGQSYGLLNNRAAVEFMQRVWDSEYKNDIHIISLIHDAIYLLWPDDAKITLWVNQNLTECMSWQELPEIQHETVKLNAELDIFYPSWKYGMTIPNDCDEETLYKCIKQHQKELEDAA